VKPLVLAGVVAALVGASACAARLPQGDHHEFEHLGWLTWSGDGLAKHRPQSALPPDFATLSRDRLTNALSVVISPVRSHRLTSILVPEYTVLLRFSAGTDLRCAVPARLDFPLDASNEVSVAHMEVDGALELVLTTSRLGRDLVLATLLSPAGIVGALHCDDRLVWLRGRAVDPGSAYASVWRQRTRSAVRLHIVSEVEYPVDVHRLVLISSGTALVYSGPRRVNPWGSLVVRLPQSFEGVVPVALSSQAAPIVSTPVTYQQFAGEVQ